MVFDLTFCSGATCNRRHSGMGTESGTDTRGKKWRNTWHLCDRGKVTLCWLAVRSWELL